MNAVDLIYIEVMLMLILFASSRIGRWLAASVLAGLVIAWLVIQ